MEIVIAIILIFIMVLLDTNSLGKFLAITRPIKENLTDSYKDFSHDLAGITNKTISTEKIIKKIHSPNLWIYNDETISSRHWKNFYSRRYKQPTSSLINLCIKSVIRHSCHNYTIKIFSQNDLNDIIPEYMSSINNCSSEYMKYNLIKYAVLYKYGGVWIPKDTLMFKPLSYLPRLDCNYITTFGNNNVNYMDQGISDSIIASGKNNIVTGQMLSYLIRNTLTFQNALVFKQSINKHFNKILNKSIYHVKYNSSMLEKCSGDHYTVDDMFTTNIVKFQSGNLKETININVGEIEDLREFNYLLRMSERQILNSNLFIGLLIKKAFS